jgi:hypothetical protein
VNELAASGRRLQAASLANNALHTDGAPAPRCARGGAPRVSARAFGGLERGDHVLSALR